MIRARDLRPGDKVNGHECGWLIVLSVKRHGYNGWRVRYDTMDGVKDIIYYPWSDMVEAVRV